MQKNKARKSRAPSTRYHQKNQPSTHGVPQKELDQTAHDALIILFERGQLHVSDLPALDDETKRSGFDQLISDGIVKSSSNQPQCWVLDPQQSLLLGKVIAHQDGFGFVQPDPVQSNLADAYLPKGQMHYLLQSDQVVVRLHDTGHADGYQAQLLYIVARGREQLVGRIIEGRNSLRLIPDDPKVRTRFSLDESASDIAGVKPGDMVVGRITTYPSPDTSPRVAIVRKLDDSHLAGMATEIAIIEHELPEAFSTAALKQAETYGETIDTAAIEGRKDIRALPLITIDGADARDFDDAVFCAPSGKGWRLVVAIADVSSYVWPDSALDKDAIERGTSVYFPTQVIPMLPEALSNGLCSLRPQVDRLALVCDMQFDRNGKRTRSRFYPAVMRSHARLTYMNAQALLDNPDDAVEQTESVVANLQHLHQLWRLLSGQREQRGALEFDRPETGFIWAEDGSIARLEPRVRVDTHRIIEECMIAANVAAAEFLLKTDKPALYRVHPAPGGDKLQDLERFLLQHQIKPTWKITPTPLDFTKLQQALSEHPARDVISDMLLRAQSLAVYEPKNQGHFGLSLDAYCHFTSPIRRYPDLLVHRAIYQALDFRQVKQRVSGKSKSMSSMGTHCSFTERRAEDASRQVEWRLKCDYMQQFAGKTFKAIVSGVKRYGVFLDLPEQGVSGLAHVSNLGQDYYEFDEASQALINRRTGRRIRLADNVNAKLLRVDQAQRQLDFALV